MIDFSFSKEIVEVFPNIAVGILIGQVTNSEHNPELWQEINASCNSLQRKHDFESIREIPPIAEGKNAYRDLGKDPNRYRLSAEALLRRIVKGQSIYQIHSLVDALNLTSIRTGITIGGFDLDLINGPVILGIGQADEEFDAIGRGSLNIHRLPVYRDKTGPIGSPTSDCTRTMLSINTRNFLMLITGFYGPDFLRNGLDSLKDLLSKYVNGRNFQELIINSK